MFYKKKKTERAIFSYVCLCVRSNFIKAFGRFQKQQM